jgi:hypothetical protein
MWGMGRIVTHVLPLLFYTTTAHGTRYTWDTRANARHRHDALARRPPPPPPRSRGRAGSHWRAAHTAALPRGRLPGRAAAMACCYSCMGMILTWIHSFMAFRAWTLAFGFLVCRPTLSMYA